MNIFTRKKALLDTIANLEEQIRIQSNEMEKLCKANTDLNRLWRDAVKENKRLEQEVIDTREAKRIQGDIDNTALAEKDKTIKGLLADIAEKDHTIAELHDTTSGLASSVSDLKARLRKATADRKPKRNPKAASNHEQTSQQ